MDQVILKFENINPVDLVLVLDPPCVDYTIMPGKHLFLKVKNVDGSSIHHEDVTIRYDVNNIINIDMSIHHKIMIMQDSTEEVIWKGL